jgi:glycerophosphoryl diester phosphodiesterase
MSAAFSTLARPLVIGHRGASGHAVENSIRAFELAAMRTGPTRCDGVEFDVHTTADGVFVVHHDPFLANGACIAELPFSTVRASRLADGSEIPTLAEALSVLEAVAAFVEVKGLPADSDAAFLAILAQHGRAASHVHAFDHRVIARLRRLDGRISLGLLSASYPVRPLQQLIDAGATTLWQEIGMIDRQLVDACHHAGCFVIAWTVNDQASAHRLAEIGVDGLCGNWPERLHPTNGES